MKYFLAVITLLLSALPAHAQQLKPDTARMDQIVSTYYDHKQFTGSVLVTRGDQVLFDKSYGYANLEWDVPFTSDAKFRLGSLTKQFTAASILLLQERGKLKTSDLISLYLPNTPPTWSKITIRNLLTHTSGIMNFTEVPNAYVVQITPTTPEKEYLSFRDKPLEFQPGEKFSYSNSNYILLGMIIEKASGMKYADFLQQNIFKPLHMTDTDMDSNYRIVHHRVSGYGMDHKMIVNDDYANMTVPFAAGALYSTTHDLATWNNALYGGKLLKPESLTEMTTPYKGTYAYGLEISIINGHQRIAHGGAISGFLDYLTYDSADKLSVIVLSNYDDCPADKIAAQLASVVHGQKVILASERKPISVSPKILEQYLGIYAISPKLAITITLDGDHLEAQGTNQPMFPLFAESNTKFFSTEPDAQFEFFRNNKNEVDHMIVFQDGMEFPGTKK